VARLIPISHPGEAIDLACEGVLGRGRDCRYRFAGSDSLSREHARIYFDGTMWLASDLGSSNGSWLNDAPFTTTVVCGGDFLKFGALIFRFDVSLSVVPLDDDGNDNGGTPGGVDARARRVFTSVLS